MRIFYILLFLISFVFQSEAAWFNWDYTGPDTLTVGANCTAALRWGGDDAIICEPTFQGQEVIIKKLKSISGGYSYGDPVHAGEIVTVVYEATDNYGHKEDFTFTITFIDVIPPVFVPGTLPPDITVQCPVNLPNFNVSATDNCTPAFQIEITIELNFPDKPCAGEYQRKFIAHDAYGNTSEYIQHITLQADQTAPVITQEAEDTLATCSANGAQQAFENWISNHGGALATDNCGIYGWTTIPADPQFSGSCNDPVEVTFVVQDFCGNSDSTTASFTVADTIAPVILSPSRDSIIDCVANPILSFADWLETGGHADVSDNCSPELNILYRFRGVEISDAALLDTLAAHMNDGCSTVIINGIIYDRVKAALPVQFYFSDFCDNAVSDSALFVVLDTLPPVLLTPGADSTVFSCVPGGLTSTFTEWFQSGAGAGAADSCSAIVWQGTPDLQTALDSLLGAPEACNQSISIRFWPADVCGNETTDSFDALFVIKDTDGPEFTTAPQDYLLSCGDDNGNDSIQSWITRKAGAAIADCNNALWDSFSWLSSTGDSGTGLFGAGPYPELDSANCSIYVDVAFKAIDDCGNISIDTARFNSGDVEPPIIVSEPNDTTISCGQIVPDLIPVFADNCGLNGSPVLSETDNRSTDPGLCAFYQYDITRTWTATDKCGNTTEAVQLIHIVDTTAPAPLETITDLILDCGEEVPDSNLHFNDGCSTASVQFHQQSNFNPDPNQCSHFTYDIYRQYIATDLCANADTFSQHISIRDTIAPEFLASDSLIVPCMDSLSLLNIVKSLVIDNCSDSIQLAIHTINTDDSLQCSQGIFYTYAINAQDICANQVQDTLIVRMIDQIPPVLISPASDVIIDCPDFGPGTDSMFISWLADRGGSQAEDACTDIHSFAAVPGSYDPNDPNTFPGTLPAWDSVNHCQSGNLINIPVDFVYYDLCGNATVTSAAFRVSDTIAPVIVYCPADTTIITDSTNCSAVYRLPVLTAEDACSYRAQDTLLETQVRIFSAQPGNINVPVDSAYFTFGPMNQGKYFSRYSTGKMVITLQTMDAEGDDEYFNLYGENGDFLGTTEKTDTQCGNSITIIQLSEDQFNQYKTDNYIKIKVVPFKTAPGEGSKTVNDICGGSSIHATLEVLQAHSELRYAYKLDGGDKINYSADDSIALNLKEGHHTLEMFASDCGNNEIGCSQEIFIKDTVPPAILCPDDIAVSLSAGRCDTVLAVPLPLKIEDNCGLGDDFDLTVPSDTASAWLTFHKNPDLHNFLADGKQYTFEGVDANVNDKVRLNIYLQGNVESGKEYFYIYDEDNNLLGKTQAGQGNVTSGNCHKPSTIYFNISAARFNEMAADNAITFKAVPFEDFTIPPDNEFSGINPCAPNSVDRDGETDSSSYMFMELVYTSYTPPSYYAEGATQIALTELAPPYNPPTLRFKAGRTYFHYLIADRSGNADTCTVQIDVQDVIPPVARCQTAIVYVHPSGVIPGILGLNKVNNGSSDNCGIDSMYLSRDSFYCADLNTEFPVTLFVVDHSGNIDSCTTTVKVQEAILNPLYRIGICDNDTLRLFANMPDTAIFNDYTYEWSGPNGFTSNLENPVIPNVDASYSGTYTLKASGFNGCGGSGVAQVFINSEINTPLIFARDTVVCSGSNIELSTQAYSGSVRYYWYEGTAPDGVLLDSTIVPAFSFNKPEGQYLFYVIIRENNCVSNPSASLGIRVRNAPLSMVDQSMIAVCEGGSIALGTPINGNGISYQWTGPNGFSSTDQYPAVIQPATLADAGTYSLVIIDGDCQSLPSEVEVTVSKRPSQPIPYSNGPVCINSTLILSSNLKVDIDSFIWKKPDGTLIYTDTSKLVISQAGLDDDGLWTLTLLRGGCSSLESIPLDVEVQSVLSIDITYNSPICEGDSVQLFTTDIPGATYRWTGPGGFNSVQQNPWVVAVFGTYSVEVNTSSGCVSQAETTLNLFPKPKIRNLHTNAQACQHPEDLVVFSYELNLSRDSVSYYWTGPAGFSSTDSILQIPGSTINNGIYSLIIFSDRGCKSDTARVSVQVQITPRQPLISGPDKICSGDSLILTVTNQSNPGQYIWHTPQGDKTTTTNQYIILAATSQNSGIYTVAYSDGNCQSKYSDTLQVSVYQTPAKPLIIGDPTVCLGDTILLQTNQAPGLDYHWIGPNGLVSSVPDWQIFPAINTNEGIYMLTVERNGCISDASDAFQLTILQPPATPVLVDPGGEICLDQSTLVVCIDAGSATAGANYSFYLSGPDALIAGPTNAICGTVSNYHLFSQGENQLYAIATLNGCPSEKSIPVTLNVSIPPEELAKAGSDQILCSEETTNLSAAMPTIATGKWSALTPGTIIADPTDPNTRVSGLHEGANYFVWSLSYNKCVDFSADTVIIWLPKLNSIKDDVFRLQNGATQELNVGANDDYLGLVDISVSSNPQNGSVQINPQGTLSYTPDNESVTFDRFEYTVCLRSCDLCLSAQVVVDIDDPNDCIIPNIITPNNDNINDVLRIPCLDQGGANESELAIFNEWGSEVFREAPYHNDWKGTFKGNPLPVGTYYYIFRKSRSAEVQKGFLIIKR